MKMVMAVIRHERLQEVQDVLDECGVSGVTVTEVPLTLTSRKWKTWPAEIGLGALQDEPLLLEYDQPIA